MVSVIIFLAVVYAKTSEVLSDIDYFQPSRTVSFELVGNEREYWQSKDKKGRENQKVTQPVLLACGDLTL